MTADINPVQFGRMIEALESLTTELKSHRRVRGFERRVVHHLREPPEGV